jgi:hypothetical protein
VRQRREFERHAQCGKLGLDMVAPTARAFQAFPEPIGQPLLEAYAPGGRADLPVASLRNTPAVASRRFLMRRLRSRRLRFVGISRRS